MGILLADLFGGLGGGGCLVFAGLEAAVEGGHKSVGAGVVNVPEGQKQGAGSGVKGATDQAEQFVARRHDVESGGAAAEGEQFGVEAHLVELVEMEISIAQSDAGE